MLKLLFDNGFYLSGGCSSDEEYSEDPSYLRPGGSNKLMQRPIMATHQNPIFNDTMQHLFKKTFNSQFIK